MSTPSNVVNYSADPRGAEDGGLTATPSRAESVSQASDVPEKRGIVAASNIISVIRPKDLHIAYAA